MTKVYIGIMTGGEVRAELASALISMSQDQRYEIEIEFGWARPIPANRCRIAKKSLAMGADYVLMIDADTWPHYNLLDLVEYDLDIVAFPCPIWRPGEEQPPIVMNITPLNGSMMVDLESDEPFEIARGGFSAVLFARRVLEEMGSTFAYTFDDEGMTSGDEDIMFCDEARKRGFKVWTAPQHVCEHFKTMGLLQATSGFARTRGTL